MGRDTVTPSKDEISIARHGIFLQLKETTKLVEMFGSLAEAIEQCGLGDFIDNNIQATACDRAWVRFMENLLREKLEHKTP